MVQMPHRSVTRFFIPMIDVLILLFSIYLLMPLASKSDAESVPESISESQRESQSDAVCADWFGAKAIFLAWHLKADQPALELRALAIGGLA